MMQQGLAPLTMAINGETVPKEKRKRQAAACDACRRSKRGCDGKVPCKVCVQRGTECTFLMTRRRITRKRASPTGGPSDMTSTESAAMSASNTAVMLDMFFDHWSCFFGCIKRESLSQPNPSISQRFLLHSVLALVNRSYGDPETKQLHERDARAMAGQVIDQFTEETAQGYIILAFFYVSENISLSGHFARMAESVLQEAEVSTGRTCGIMKLRGLCRSLRLHTDPKMLMETDIRLPDFLSEVPVEIQDSCVMGVQEFQHAVLGILVRSVPDLQRVLFSTNPFGHELVLPEELLNLPYDNMVACLNFSHKKLREMSAMMPIAAQWGCHVVIAGTKALVQLIGKRTDDALATCEDMLTFERPTAVAILAVKPMVVPFLAVLAATAKLKGRTDLLVTVSQMLLRLGKIFHTALLGYTELSSSLPNASQPAPSPPLSSSPATIAFGSPQSPASSSETNQWRPHPVQHSKPPVDVTPPVAVTVPTISNQPEANGLEWDDDEGEFDSEGEDWEEEVLGQGGASLSDLAGGLGLLPTTALPPPSVGGPTAAQAIEQPPQHIIGEHGVIIDTAGSLLSPPPPPAPGTFCTACACSMPDPSHVCQPGATNSCDKEKKCADPWMCGVQNWDDPAQEWDDFWLLSQTLNAA